MSAVIRNLGLQEYQTVWRDMQRYTEERNEQTNDQIWVLEHYPVYTLGLNGKKEHLLQCNQIPVVNCDRGGQVTFHAPGQLVVYLLLDIARLKRGAREIVTILEQSMVNTLSQYGISAKAKPEAPGVYVDNKKIGSVGLRVKKGCCYHGLSLNNAMDLSPFKGINPCGYEGLEVTQVKDLGVSVHTSELAVPVVHQVLQGINS